MYVLNFIDMEENYIFKKGRKRLYSGKLSNFNLLNDETQETFKEITNELKSNVGDDIKVYVFGSYFWGYADNESDYDVRIDNVNLNEKLDLKEVSEKISNKLEKLVHVVYVDKKRVRDEGILIP